MRRPGHGQAAGEPDDAGLGGGVGHVGGQAEDAAGRGHHDSAVAAIDHVRPGGAGGVERADRVHGQVSRQVVLVCLGEPGPADDAGVVDQDVEPPELLDRGGHDCAGSRGGGEVAGVAPVPRRHRRLICAATAAAGPVSAPVPSMAPPRSLTTTDAPRARQQHGVGASDAPSGARDDGDPAVEAVLLLAVAQAATGALKPRRPPRVPPTMASRSSGGTPANCSAMSWRLPRNVPSACG